MICNECSTGFERAVVALGGTDDDARDILGEWYVPLDQPRVSDRGPNEMNQDIGRNDVPPEGSPPPPPSEAPPPGEKLRPSFTIQSPIVPGQIVELRFPGAEGVRALAEEIAFGRRSQTVLLRFWNRGDDKTGSSREWFDIDDVAIVHDESGWPLGLPKPDPTDSAKPPPPTPSTGTFPDDD